MAAPEDFDQDGSWLSYNAFDAYLQPMALEQVDEHAEFSTLLGLDPRDQGELTDVPVLGDYSGHLPMMQLEQGDESAGFNTALGALPNDQGGLRDIEAFDGYSGYLPMLQEPGGETDALPELGDFQDGTDNIAGLEGFFDAPMMEDPNPSIMPQCNDYGNGGNCAMPPIESQSTTSMFSEYHPIPTTEGGVYWPPYSQQDVPPFTIGNQTLLNSSGPMALPPLTAAADGNLESQTMAGHDIAAPAPIPSSSTYPSTRKREPSALHSDIYLPPLKRGGRRGPMSLEQRKERKEMTRKGACITCHVRKDKCDGEVPCGSCRKKIDSRIPKNPCAKAHFYGMVESEPCYAFSVIFESVHLQNFDNRSLLERVATAAVLLQSKTFLQIRANTLWPVTASVSWGNIFEPFLSNSDFESAKQLSHLPQMRPILAKAPSVLAKKRAESKSGLVFHLRPDATIPQHTIAEAQLNFCAAPHHEFYLVKSAPDQGERILEERAHNSASLLLWLLTRQCEIRLFHYIQNSVNQLDTTPSADLGRTIPLLLKAIYSLSPHLDERVMESYSDEEITLDKDVLQQVKDRHKRLRVALFVYTNIACSKLPAFSDFWTGLAKSSLKFTQQEFRKLLADLDTFDSALKAREEETDLRVDRLERIMGVLDELNPDALVSATSEVSGLPSSLVDYVYHVQNGLPEKPIKLYDQQSTEGLLSATISGSFSEMRAWKFYFVAKIDWVRAFSHFSSSEIDPSVSDLGLFFLASHLKARILAVRTCEIVGQNLAEAGCLAANIFQAIQQSALSAIFHDIETTRVPAKIEQKRVLLTLRYGLRWRELKELVGEEIYLLVHPLRYSTTSNGIQSLDVPFIVANGSDAEFNRLKRLLVTSQSWLKECCLELKGVVQWFKEAVRVVKTDKDTALNLAGRIQQHVFRVLGGREFLDKVLAARMRMALQAMLGTFSEHRTDALEQVLCEMDARIQLKMKGTTLYSWIRQETEEPEEEEPGDEQLEELTRSTKVFLEALLEP